ncbi:5-hydroxytryptamine receptor 7 [Maylandia zebra]|uniref:5-hydroxytryptamine receptor 7 n=2 Tax=Haplochromini TaxID=319058 RepID=A0A3P9DQF4_9CICH|nr:5-hydroxytryptamine receptor 7 [Maylandia zebra]XP_005937071.1 5-hydroxytryptamine receptor 7 [Haplochromis burtoni]XP_026046549.1 5-hydroxytryptamine receptor 7 [Astatotilapia calliptera]XP_039889969.1 5-hydroxytryptamine receptor 7-like [Simochromis diagramma]
MVVAGASNGTFGSGNMRSSFMIEDIVGGGDPGGSTNMMISEALALRLLKAAQGAADAAAAAAAATSPSTSSQPQVMETNGTRCGEQILSYGRVEKVLIGAVLTMLTLSTICGNLLVVISVCFVKKLRQPSNYLIVSLALADLSVALAVMPFVSITDLIGGQWIFGQFFCNVFIAMDVMCCTASIMTLCVISIDRYLGITKPLTYPVRQNGCCMAKMILSVWLLSASITLPPLFGWAQNVNDGRVCLISQDFGYTVYSTAVAFYIPMSVMLIMYYRIYRAAKLSAAKHTITGFPREGEHRAVVTLRGGRGGHQPAESGETGSVEGTEVEQVEEAEEEESLDCVAAALKLQREVEEECSTRVSRLLKTGEHHQRRKRKNQSIFKREQKAAATLGIVVGAFTFCWLPFFLVSTARPFVCGVQCSCVPLWLERTLLWLGYANSLINPFIYAFFNRDLRTTYSNLLRCRYRNINRKLSAAGMHEALKLVEKPDADA